jgi:hypothetical protein
LVQAVQVRRMAVIPYFLQLLQLAVVVVEMML